MSEPFIRFGAIGKSATGLTLIFDVYTNDEKGTVLGQVKWFPKWRAYAFFPEKRTVFEKRCLRCIADYCEFMTRAHNAAREGAKASRGRTNDAASRLEG